MKTYSRISVSTTLRNATIFRISAFISNRFPYIIVIHLNNLNITLKNKQSVVLRQLLNVATRGVRIMFAPPIHCYPILGRTRFLYVYADVFLFDPRCVTPKSRIRSASTCFLDYMYLYLRVMLGNKIF